MNTWLRACALLVAFGLMAARAESQTLYHFHRDASTTAGSFQLRTDGVTAPVNAFQSIDLKNVNPRTSQVKLRLSCRTVDGC